MNKQYDEHYVRSVVQLGDSRHVYTNQPIFTSNRIKLVEKGARVNSSLFDRLVQHKLIPKIDECLSVENSITPESLRQYAQYLLDSEPALTTLGGQRSTRDRMLRAFSGITLLPPMAFKLTVASSQRPEVFDHSIRIALISLYLARKSQFLSEKEMSLLASAAVFHDLGILHIAPELMKPGRRLSEAERHHLYAHPITGFLMLSEYPEYHPEISRAVFEHHERLDGSGYPRGLKEEEICFSAQVLMLAEVASTAFEGKQAAHNLTRLSVLLRLNQNKLNRELCHHVLEFIAQVEGDRSSKKCKADAVITYTTLETRLVEIARIFQDWCEACQTVSDAPKTIHVCPLGSIIDERIADLQNTLHYTGFDPKNPTGLIELMQDDPEALDELDILTGETRWQLAEIIHEAQRRMGETSKTTEAFHPSVISWLERSKKIVGQT